MKKTFKFFAFAAATVAMLSSCAKELVVSNEEDTVKTFTVTAEDTEPWSQLAHSTKGQLDYHRAIALAMVLILGVLLCGLS